MKRTLFIIISFVLSIASTLGQTSSKNSDTMVLGYTDSDFTIGLGPFVSAYTEGAIQYPQEKMQKLEGSRITHIIVGFADELSEQENMIFITNDLNGEPLYKQEVANFKAGWNDVKLDVPFEITGEEIFFGFKIAGKGDILSLDGSENNDYANWIRLREPKESEGSWTHQGGGCWNIKAVIEGENLPKDQVKLIKANINKYAQAGGESPVSIIVKNEGSTPIEKLQVETQINTKEPIVFTVDKLNIQSNEVQNVYIGSYPVEEASIYNLTLKITHVNETEDVNENVFTQKNIISKANYRNRKIMAEHFSTLRCPNCPIAHLRIEKASKYRQNILHVIHHSGFAKDPLTIPESEQYLFFYTNGSGEGQCYAPGLMLDRTNLSRYGATNGQGKSTPGPAFFPQRETMGEFMDKRLSTPALITTTIKQTYDTESRKVTMKVMGEVPQANQKKIDFSTLKLNVFVTEDSILGKQAQSGDQPAKETYNNYVLRKVVTETWGNSFVVDNEQYESESIEFDIPADWNVDNLKIIAFVSNYKQFNSNECEVLNAEEVWVNKGNDSSIESTWNNNDTKVYTIGKELFVEGAFTNGAIYQIAGMKLLDFDGSNAKISLDGLTSGFYLVRIQTANGKKSFKISL